MRKTILICDYCKKETITENEYFEKYKTIEIKFDNYNYNKYLLCPECQKNLGLLKEESETLKPMVDIKDRLFEIIEEIVLMNIPEN